MRVKRYIVDSMPDALQLIRSELGKDAVILNTKEVRSGGLFGLFGKKKIEVIAAVEEGASPKPPAPAPAPAMTTTPASAPAGPAPDLNQMVKEIEAVKAYASSAAPKSAPRQIADPAPENRPAPAGEPAASVSAPLMQRPAAAASIGEPAAPEADPPGDNRQLFEEIKQMRIMMERLARQQSHANPYPEPLERLAQVLREQEVDPDHVETLIGSVMEQLPVPHAEGDEELFREMLKAEIRKRWPQDRVEGIRPDSKVVHFVGPTGVGKTTTIAKLAAEQVLKHRRKVGFITSDTYRIAAVEQLKTYATILNVPLEVVFSPHELTRAFAQLKDREIIFMDTAGRNFRNEMYVSELNSLLTGSGPSETFLVLSMTNRYRDMKAIVDNFSRFKLDKVLFTKGDETDTYGVLLNMAMDYPLKFSYMTDGQNVPDDISLINVETWIDRILGGGAHA